MKKSKRVLFWVTIAATALIILGILFFPKSNYARALFSYEHAFDVLMRFESEIMQKSPAGRYYEAMAWKHGQEQVQLLRDHPEHVDGYRQLTLSFIPGLEALVDGKGDTVQITEEQVNNLKAELDWETSFGSPSLREDIEKEQQRFPLDNFIGMTFSEALDYVNSNFPPELALTPTVTQTPQPTPTPIVTQTPQSILIRQCIIGMDQSCQSMPTLVPNSDGQWAYYVSNGIYFEYPSTWRIEELMGNIFLLPTPDSPESSSIDAIYLFQWTLLDQPNPYDPLTYPQTVLLRPAPIWNRLVSLPDFTGSESLLMETSNVYVSAIFYDPNIQMPVEIRMVFKDDPTNESLYDPDLFQEQYPNFRHIVESFRIWKP